MVFRPADRLDALGVAGAGGVDVLRDRCGVHAGDRHDCFVLREFVDGELVAQEAAGPAPAGLFESSDYAGPMTTAPRRKDAARNWQAIVDVARDLVEEGTPVQLNDVARLAGVGVATVYRHFPTPDALIDALAGPAFESLVASGDEALADDRPWRALSSFLARAIEAQVADPALAQVAAGSNNAYPHTSALKHDLLEVLSVLLKRAVDAGIARPELTTSDLIPLMCGVAYAANVHGGATATRVTASRRYLEYMLNGLRVS